MEIYKCEVCNHANPTEKCRWCSGLIYPPEQRVLKVVDFDNSKSHCAVCGVEVIRNKKAKRFVCTPCKMNRRREYYKRYESQRSREFVLDGKKKGVLHGRRFTYKKYMCRCKECCAAMHVK